MFKTQKWENFGSLAPLARNSSVNFLKLLVFWSRSYHECYKHEDIIVPKKYRIVQQVIGISKNVMFKTPKLEHYGPLAPHARNHL